MRRSGHRSDVLQRPSDASDFLGWKFYDRIRDIFRHQPRTMSSEYDFAGSDCDCVFEVILMLDHFYPAPTLEPQRRGRARPQALRLHPRLDPFRLGILARLRHPDTGASAFRPATVLFGCCASKGRICSRGRRLATRLQSGYRSDYRFLDISPKVAPSCFSSPPVRSSNTSGLNNCR